MNLTLIAVVAVALAFDFTNGFHDAANAIATSVSTRAVSPVSPYSPPQGSTSSVRSCR